MMAVALRTGGVCLALLCGLAAVAAGADLRLISQGRRVALEEHLVPGKLTLFDFYADWCAPCRILEPRIDRLAERYPEQLAVRKVDVINWDSPVARQHRIASLPHLVLYGPDGQRLAGGDAERVLMVLGSRLGGSEPVTWLDDRRIRIPMSAWVVACVALIAGWLLVNGRAGRRGAESMGGHGRVRPDHRTTPGDREDVKIWFAMVDGGLEGPFSVGRLTELHRERKLSDDDRVRRRGDATWRRVVDVIDSR